MAKRVIIIGAGPAGMMAGIKSAEAGAIVDVIEQNNIVGKKMGITGKGRCNITNAAPVEELIQKTPGNGKFLFSAYSHYDNQDLLKDVESWGLPVKVERGGRVFPVSDSAIEVRNLFSEVLKSKGGRLRLKEQVLSIEVGRDLVDGVVVSRVVQVTTDRRTYPADAVIVATGGVSYPVTGSTGDGYRFATELGHSVSEPLGALVPLQTKETWVKDCMGLSLKNVTATLFVKGKKKGSLLGEMMFTHFGVTGPIVLSLSRDASKALSQNKEVTLSINMKPALSEEVLDKRLQTLFDENKNKQLANVMPNLLPKAMIPVVLSLVGLSMDKVVHQVTKEERIALYRTMQDIPLTITSTRPVAEAIVTMGGVKVKEINPKTMESKLVKGLYFAGEVLDVDALTGGYNLQAAFSTGYLAGISASKEGE